MLRRGPGGKSAGFLLFWLLLFLLLSPASLAAGFPVKSPETSQKNIIILNSYHQGLYWTDDEMSGIMDTMKKADRNLSISVEYMDWKRYDTYENLSENLKHLRYKYSGKKTDLVITTDDMATEFALNNRSAIFSNAPVVFCGVNESDASKILKNKTNVTGVIQENNPKQTVEAALKINPGIRRVYLVYDKTESGQSTGIMTFNAIMGADPSMKVTLLDNKTTDEIFSEVSRAPEDSIVICTNYLRDINGDMVGFEYFNRRLSKSSTVPVYSLYEAAIGNGVVGGSVISGRVQGERAARIALKILKGVDIGMIGLDRSPTTHLVFDYYELMRFNIDPKSLPDGSEIRNGPKSLLNEHKQLVFTISLIFILLIVFIVILLYYLSRINRMKGDLEKKNMEMSGLYDDLSKADSQLKQQYNDLFSMQKNLISSERRYALLFGKMMNCFSIVEPVFNSEKKISDIRFRKVNPAFCSQMNRREEEVIDRNWFEIFGFQNKELGIYQKLLETGGTERFETHYPDQDAYYAGNIFAITEREFGVIFDNITEYKTAIKEVKLLNASLELRVKERTKELQLALDELEAFSYTVSHDLKSPLRAIDGYCRIILEDSGPGLDEDTTVMLGNIGKISKDMIDMINKLLQYSTTSRAELKKEEVDMKELAVSVFNEQSMAHMERDISLVIETWMPSVKADRILFRQLLQNILSNAVKFTKEREKAVITIGCTLTQDKYIFYVKDNGVGFDMEYSGKLFGIFQRLHTAEEFEGFGIGLVTVRKIVEKHGGTVWIEGRVGVGATIYFTVPFSWENSQ